MAESYPNGQKTVGKEEIACTSNFSFSHSVFKRLVSQGCQKVLLCGNGLKHFQKASFLWLFNPFLNTPFSDCPKFKEAADDN